MESLLRDYDRLVHISFMVLVSLFSESNALYKGGFSGLYLNFNVAQQINVSCTELLGFLMLNVL